MRFANDFHSWLRHSWKLLANRLTRDPKIVIHGNSCIILYILFLVLQDYFLSISYVNKHMQPLSDSKVHGANMGPIWGRQDPGGPHVGPMNFAIWAKNQWYDEIKQIPKKLCTYVMECNIPTYT